jgi:drug/metabolite transporter (DMT)-like permease
VVGFAVKNWQGPVFVAIAAILWSTDAMFRLPALSSVSSVTIVLCEHLIDLVFILPWVLWKKGRSALDFTLGEWAALIFIGAGGSGIASLLFTSAFQYLNPSVVIILQKLQPLIVVLLAFAVLGERPKRSFYLWALLAIISGIFLSFPDLNFGFLTEQSALRSRGALYALAAASIWGVSTVAGKMLLNRRSATLVTFWRFAFGFAVLIPLAIYQPHPIHWSALGQPQIFRSLLYMGLIPGLLAMISYYSGMKRTQASTVTLIELLFPVSAVILNSIFLGLKLSTIQLIAGGILVFAVTMVSYNPDKARIRVKT